MTHRNFGIMTSGTAVGGNQPSRSLSSANTTRADLPPLPRGSILSDPLSDRDRSRASGIFFTVFISLVFAIPMVLAGIMLGSR